MELNINDRVPLNNGVKIPYLGFGTYKIKDGKEIIDAVSNAFEAGYRLIDTASAYGNEAGIGIAIKESGIPREEIFVTTKLGNDDHGYDKALKAFDKSISKLGTNYIDLYLIHWPVTNKRNESWEALETLLQADNCKAIGVSNYTINHLKELFEVSSTIPSVNQVEFNPFIYQPELLDFCNSKNIQLEAYTPLAKAIKMKEEKIKKLAKKYSKTPAQILLRWSLQHKLVVMPKSSNKKRIEENADIFDFELSSEDMETLNSLDEGLRLASDPHEIE